MTQQLTSEQILHNNELLIQTSKSGDVNEVKRLIPVSNPKANNSAALQWAVLKGHTKIVELLIPVSDPQIYDSGALTRAAEKGHIEIVRLLISVSDPKARDSLALLQAAKYGHTESIKLLIPVSDYQFAVKTLLEGNADVTLLQQCIEDYETLQQKERLTIEVDKVVENANKSVKRKM